VYSRTELCTIACGPPPLLADPTRIPYSGVGRRKHQDFIFDASDHKHGTVQKWQRPLEAARVKVIYAAAMPRRN